MRDDAGFIRAILADPADDTLRLVFADALEECGERERAEFIRVQCAIAADPRVNHAQSARVLADGCTCSLCALRRRERELLWATGGGRHPQFGERPNLFFWAGPALEIVPEGAKYLDYITFRRGFVDSITLPADAFLAHAATLFAAQPVTAVRLSDRQPVPAAPSHGGGWRWYWSARGIAWTGDVDLVGYFLPPALGNYVQSPRRRGRSALYGDREHALAALSAACVAFGRAGAGLPPLNARKPRPAPVPSRPGPG